MIQIISWNVAGLRACANKGFLNFVDEFRPDILALQEVKARPEQLAPELVEHPEYEIFYSPGEKKGHSGVGLWVKKEIVKEVPISELGHPEYDCEGRVQVLETNSFFLINCYFPNGRRDHSRVPFKLAFTRDLFDYAQLLRLSSGKEVIVCGDVNTAHQEMDLANPKSNLNTTGFLPVERELLSEIFSQGWIDLFRYLYPDKREAYTWWTFRGDCRARNIGWRLDYFISGAGLLKHKLRVDHLTQVYGSDHCPIKLEIH